MGKACDCVGLIVGVGLDLQIGDVYPAFDYSAFPSGEKLLTETGKSLLEQTNEDGSYRLQPVAGEVVAMTVRAGREPQHLAIIGEYKGRLTIIHAFNKNGEVVEHTLTDWWAARIVRTYRYPEVTY
jgi:hypothetical protein